MYLGTFFFKSLADYLEGGIVPIYEGNVHFGTELLVFGQFSAKSF